MTRTGDSDWRTPALLRRGGLAVAIEIASSLLAIGLVVAIERTLPAGSLGVYGVATALGIVLLVIGTLGTSPIIIREGTVSLSEFRALSVASLWSRGLFLAVVFAPALLLSPSITFGLLLLNAVGNVFIDLASAVLRGVERYVAAGVAGLLYRAIMLVLVLAVGVTGDLGLVALALVLATIVAGLVAVKLSFTLAQIRVGEYQLRNLVQTLRRHRAEAVSINLWLAAYGATSRIDVAIVGALAGTQAATGYVAAAVLGAGLTNVASTVLVFVLPRLSALRSRHVGRETYRIAGIGFAAAAVCALPAILAVDPIVHTLYGTGRSLAVTSIALKIFIAAFPFVVASRVLFAGLIAVSRPRQLLAIQAAGVAWLALGVIAGYQLAGLRGAAVGSASADVVMLGLALLAWSPSASAPTGLPGHD